MYVCAYVPQVVRGGKGVAQRLDKLLEEHVVPNAVQSSVAVFKEQLYGDSTRGVLERHGGRLETAFSRCTSGTDPRITEDVWKGFAQRFYDDRFDPVMAETLYIQVYMLHVLR